MTISAESGKPDNKKAARKPDSFFVLSAAARNTDACRVAASGLQCKTLYSELQQFTAHYSWL
jgi:hypothetical protein